MWFYLVIFLLIIIWLIAASHKYVKNEVYVAVPLVLLALVIGLRWQTGKDIATYERIYNNIVNGANYKNIGYGYSIEVTYYIITRVLNKLHFSFQALVLLYSASSFAFIYKALMNIKVKKEEFALFVLTFYAVEFTTYFIIMRQFLAASILFYVFTMKIEEKKDYLISFFLLLLTGLIHSGAFIILPVFYILRLRIFKSYIFKFSMLLMAIYIGTSEFVFEIINQLIVYFAKYANYFNRSNFGSSSGSSKILDVLLVFYIVLLIFDALKNVKEEEEIKVYNSILVTFAIYYASLVLGYFNRAYWYMAIFLCLIPVYGARRLFKDYKNYRLIYTMVTGFIISVYIAYYFMNLERFDPTMIPYKFSLDFRI